MLIWFIFISLCKAQYSNYTMPSYGTVIARQHWRGNFMRGIPCKAGVTTSISINVTPILSHSKHGLHLISVNVSGFLLCKIAKLTNRFHCNSQCKACSLWGSLLAVKTVNNIDWFDFIRVVCCEVISSHWFSLFRQCQYAWLHSTEPPLNSCPIHNSLLGHILFISFEKLRPYLMEGPNLNLSTFVNPTKSAVFSGFRSKTTVFDKICGFKSDMKDHLPRKVIPYILFVGLKGFFKVQLSGKMKIALEPKMYLFHMYLFQFNHLNSHSFM